MAMRSGKLTLRELTRGLPGITMAFGETLAEAGAICFESQNHSEGVELHVNGAFKASYKVFWQQVTEQMIRCWNDTEYATEQGAYGIAILLMLELTDYTVIERSRRGSGFDYWLGRAEDTKELPFQNMARLEVSGIRSGDDGLVRARVNRKLMQVGRSDDRSFPVYVVVVEFKTPSSQVVKQ